MKAAEIDSLAFERMDGLLPAVVQHAGTGEVLMLGYMNREALRETLSRRRVVFFSRSRQRLWEKGETSGNSLDLHDVRADCDGDALLVTATPRGPVCHRGTNTCFAADRTATDSGARGAERPLTFLTTLDQLIEQRIEAQPEGSYTAQLVSRGPRRVAQKVGEEGLEVALAAVGGSDAELISESADLLFHLLVLLKSRHLSLDDVVRELQSRHAAR
ncbi:MAG: bifunctional phosphoribosyl-AMP cyclohydrolase/phosphoribosyl-ATP diphosphatase HisIE [Sinobacteraceae bacterium]|nr:bifunctional phosphoribosyl-AMP cyclohydrolase/phosphoribosyl-ATP diphosphatase HisIE [Nevskiaceae bacterium]